MSARLEELFEICIFRNINVKSLQNNYKIYVYIEQPEYYKNIQHILENSKLATLECIFSDNKEQSLFGGINGACELIGRGWAKEAIPVIHKKKSLISGFFSKLFS